MLCDPSTDNKKMKQVYIKTYGCQMNEHDSERMYGLLLNSGFKQALREEDADLLLVNSCSIREKAEQKAFSSLGRLKALKAKKPQLRIGFGGCIAQREGKKIIRRAPYVDLIFGTKNIHRLPLLVEKMYKMCKRQARVVEICHDAAVCPEQFRCPVERAGQFKGWVTIMQGCNNYCTYCVVPYVRGREWSRPPEDIAAEIRQMADQGYKEVTLLGQNVNSYGQAEGYGVNFPTLLRAIEKISGIERIRFTTSHPKDFSAELVEVIADSSKVCEHIHLPFQSGSDTILKSMNRKYTQFEYLKKVEILRNKIPGAALTSDVIVGFPGEKEEDFQQTLRLIEEVRFDGLFTFLYSIRPQTAAGNFSDQVPSNIKQERFEIMLQMQNEISSERNKALLGSRQEVLVEKVMAGKDKFESNKRLRGRTRLNKIVDFTGPPEFLGTLQETKIIRANRFNLEGELISERD